MRWEYMGLSVPAFKAIAEMNRFGAEGWRVVEARPQRVNGIAELGAGAGILILFERQITGPA